MLGDGVRGILTAPASHDRAAKRLTHIARRIEAGTLPACALVPLTDPQEPISAAVERAGAGAVNLAVVPVLAFPMWAFSQADRLEITRRLHPPS